MSLCLWDECTHYPVSSVCGTDLHHLSTQVPSALPVALTIPAHTRPQGRELPFLATRALQRCKLGENKPKGQSAGVMSQAAGWHPGMGLGVTHPGRKAGAEENPAGEEDVEVLETGSPPCTMGGQEDTALVVKGGCWVHLLHRAPWTLTASQQ